MPSIMSTLTPAQVLDPRLLRELCNAGMSAVRINTAHLQSVSQLSTLAECLKEYGLTVLIDTKGPEMRTTAIDGDGCVSLAVGSDVRISGTDADLPSSALHIYVNFPHIHEYVSPGCRLLIDDGKLVLEAVNVDCGIITARVITGGVLGSRKGIAVEGVEVNLPAVSAHDREYIAYAAASPCIDVIAHSFVRSAADVLAVRAAMGDACKPVIAKIESQSGIDNLDSIIAVADGILIARGDLTASIGAAAVPAAQQLIASKTFSSGKPLYLATNILPSMMQKASPSAADVIGIERALAQHVDVFLLTNETAAGLYPVECVKAISEVIKA